MNRTRGNYKSAKEKIANSKSFLRNSSKYDLTLQDINILFSVTFPT